MITHSLDIGDTITFRVKGDTKSLTGRLIGFYDSLDATKPVYVEVNVRGYGKQTHEVFIEEIEEVQ